MRQQIKSTSKHFYARKLQVGKTLVRITTPEEVIEVDIEEGVSEEITLPPQGTVLTDVSVSMNATADTLYGFYPSKGTHIVRFAKFSARQGEEPHPRTQAGGERKLPDGRKWFAPDRRVFTALLEVMAGDFKGCMIPLTLDYAFEKGPDGNCFISAGKKAIGKITTFLDLCGVDTSQVEIPWSENILPDLEQMLSELAGDTFFQCNMKDGWVDECASLPAGFNFRAAKGRKVVEDDLEEEVKPKRKNPNFMAEEGEEEEEGLVPPKKVVRPVATKVTVKKPVVTDDEEWADDDDPPAEEPPAKKRRAF